ncbi:RTA1 like protein-domain-containing protein [Apodospora peruviana]|uniref:RTA1 like protein-domain-containing protein n=1 Tax=Apodospora peruviana TaxID=516989 RepID=A0AAE0M311_9PEZI|nr:RTA1 like protein-domain-containing protein [Apodospora peruviana]
MAVESMTERTESISVWMYNPSFALAVLASILYGFSFLAIFYLTVIKYRSWYFTSVVAGAAIEVVGYGMRCYSVRRPTDVGPFVATLSLIVLAPVFVTAGNYLLIGRLIQAILPPTRHRIICAGSGVASSKNWTGPTEKIGVNILIAGLGFQVVTFVAFMAIFGRFHFLARREATAAAPRGWQKLVRAVYVSSLSILIRCIYRVAEFAEGVDGYPFRQEWLFWVFEAAPMLVAISNFCVFHPGAFLGRRGGGGKRRVLSNEEDGAEMTSSAVRSRHIYRGLT